GRGEHYWMAWGPSPDCCSAGLAAFLVISSSLLTPVSMFDGLDYLPLSAFARSRYLGFHSVRSRSATRCSFTFTAALSESSVAMVRWFGSLASISPRYLRARASASLLGA